MTSFLKLSLLASVALVGWTAQAEAAFKTQCPQTGANGTKPVCVHLAAGDGWITMADGTPSYIFGYVDVTGTPDDQIAAKARLDARFAAPSLVFDEGNEVYLTLSNIGFVNRPDLFDPHTVHFHGFPNAASVFDGEPEASFGSNPGSSFTYYYNLGEPGTYMYHCHQEAAEHMQMGMLGNLYVRPRQNKLADTVFPSGFQHRQGNKYVYNDGDGKTFYDVEAALQIEGFDPAFHQANESTQPLPFAAMETAYPLMNGRGYPDTVNPGVMRTEGPLDGVAHPSQPYTSLVKATQGQKVLLRLSNLDIQRFYTLASTLPLRIVGKGGRILRGGGEAKGLDLSYVTNSVTLGGGESADAILDTTGIPPGTYFLYTTNFNLLSNGEQDYGGLMTEIVIAPNP